MSERVLILGAGYAGLMAALRTAKQTQGKAEVTLVSAEDAFCERIRLHEVAAGATEVRHPIAGLLAGMEVRFRQGVVRELQPSANRVRIEEEWLDYDRLIYALGSQVDVAKIHGVQEHAFTLDAAGSRRLAAVLPRVAGQGGQLLVVGGGLTGIEAAAELSEAFSGLRVTLLCEGAVAPMLSERGRAYIRAALKRRGVTLAEQVSVQAIEQRTAHSTLGPVPFDLCLWAGGFLASRLGQQAGLQVNERGQIRVDAWLRALSHPSIYVAGDAASLGESAESLHPPLAMSCKAAMPLGAHAADNVSRAVLRQPEKRFAFGDSGICVSLGRRDGLIQVSHRDGTPTNTIITGRMGAWLKERVCRYTVTMLKWERHALWQYRWLRPAAKRTLLDSAASRRLAV